MSNVAQEMEMKVISEDRKDLFRTARPANRPDINSHKLISDFSASEHFMSSAFHKFYEKSEVHSKGDCPIYEDPRVETLKSEWKFCPIMQKQYNYKCCIYFGLFRLKLQKILHSIPCHILVSLLVLIGVSIVVFQLFLASPEFAICRSDEDCENKCNNNTELSRNGTEQLVCGYVGLTHQCVRERDTTTDVGRILRIMTISILSIFLVEIAIKIFAFGLTFFKKCFEVFDAVVVIVSFTLDVMEFFFEERKLIILFGLLIILRLWKVVHVITSSFAAYEAMKKDKRKRKAKKQFKEEAEHHLGLMKEYDYAKCEIIRMRELLVGMDVNPFPPEYELTELEVSTAGCIPKAV